MTAPRTATVERNTGETRIRLRLDVDGSGRAAVSTGVGFLDHMLELLACHGVFDLDVGADGDLQTDDHHVVEDVGIVLGRAIAGAIADKAGIARCGSAIQPMDEVLVLVAVDLGGRFAFRSGYRPRRERLGALACEMVNHFFSSLALEASMNLHFRFLDEGENEHHRVEAMFKGFARALREAAAVDPRRNGRVPTTKGAL